MELVVDITMLKGLYAEQSWITVGELLITNQYMHIAHGIAS